MAIIRSDFHTNLARQLRDNVFYNKTNVYYYIGKTEAWVDEVDPEPIQTNENDTIIRDNIFYVRKITTNDVSLVCVNNTWSSGEVCAQWDHTQEMAGTTYYVVTDEFNVYKCLNNNSGAASTVKPTGTSFGTISTADGYLWKYMYNVPITKRRRFLSTDYIPVQTALTDSFYSKGAVEQVIVTDGGTGYSSATSTTVLVTGDCTTPAEILVYVNDSTGEIDSYEIINRGAGYSTPPTLTVVGIGQNKYAENNGVGTAILQAILDDDGEVDRVAIIDPGVNYVADAATTIVVDGDGTGAVFYPKIQSGVVIGVIVGNPGINYTYINLSVVGTGTGAELTPIINASDFLSDQSQVEQAAVPGAIYAINVTNGGEGYTSTTTVTIEGDGTGATAKATVVDGAVSKIDMVTYGSGYTYTNIVISDVNRFEPNDFEDATSYGILPPIGGHGVNAEEELYGNTLGVYVLIRDEGSLSTIHQDYRQFGLIQNPVDVTTRKLVTNTSYIVSFTCTLASTVGINVDDVLVNNNKRYRVAQILAGNKVELQQISSIYSVPSGNFIHADTEITYNLITVDATPSLDKYSGNLLYVSNTSPFIPTGTQAFGVRTYITF